MAVERRAEESRSLNQTRLIESAQYFETSGRCNFGNHPLAGESEIGVESSRMRNRKMQAKVNGRR